jgi:outer membrane protein OmpA-like peptidoglycan-associated protein/tetratricopeptide (TPR) repeat protein
MRTLILTLLLGLISNICFSQGNVTIAEKRNTYNEKGNYYFDKNDFKKAIVYYNMAYQKDASDLFSVLRKAEAYTKLKLFPQAEECYRIVFESNPRLDNAYRLKYAYVLLADNKPEEFKHWLGIYSKIVDEEIQSENVIVSKENRIKLYKDTSIVLGSNTQLKDTIRFKIKYEGFHRRRSSVAEENQIFLVMDNGNEYSITASGTNDFNFSFQPMDNYKLIVQRENIEAENILANNKLTPEQRKTNFLKPTPVQKDEVLLQKGMKYQFSSGKYKIPPQYINSLKELAGDYQNPAANAVDLTALVKELQLADGDIYTIRFVKVEDPVNTQKKFEISTVTLNDKVINILGESFLVVLPDRLEENFAIQTDIEELKKSFNPKKYALTIDEGPIFKEEIETAQKWLLSLTVNTESAIEVKPENRFSANEISIIPSTEYILTLSKPDPKMGKNIEIIVPLTRGVKYNLSSSEGSNVEYRKALAEFLTGRKGLELSNEEVIDISVLSKELEVKQGEDLSFTLLPTKQLGKKLAAPDETKSTLTLDGRDIEINRDEKYSINVPFNPNGKVNLQTDIAYIQQNFDANTYILKLDTISFASEISIDTAGYNRFKTSGWLCMSVNTDSVEEVEKQDQFIANEVSIITGKEYILTVSKTDAETGKVDEIIVPLLRHVKYDFTSNPDSEEEYKKSIDEFMSGRKDIETVDGAVIDITLLSKELQIEQGDAISFSLLPVKKLSKKPTTEDVAKSSLFMDSRVVEFTQIQKYTINMPLNDDRQVNMQTNIEYLQHNFEASSFKVDVDTNEFFSEITVDTTGYNARFLREEGIIKDPVYDIVTVNFNLNEFALSAEAKKTIQDKVVNELKGDNRLYVTIKGYTDALGDAAYNLNLSKKRAESVKEFLKSNAIGDNRIRTLSFGASQLVEKNINWKALSEAELRKYRKVEIIIYLPK